MRLPTDEELELIHKSVMLPLLLVCIDGEERVMRQTKSSMQRLFVRSVRRLYDLVSADLAATRRELLRRKIKVHDDPKPEYAVHYLYIVDGFSAQAGIRVEEARREIGHLLSKYIYQAFTG